MKTAHHVRSPSRHGDPEEEPGGPGKGGFLGDIDAGYPRVRSCSMRMQSITLWAAGHFSM